MHALRKSRHDPAIMDRFARLRLQTRELSTYGPRTYARLQLYVVLVPIWAEIRQALERQIDLRWLPRE